MKKLGIDARLIGQTGVGVYIQNLLYFLPKYLPKDCDVYVYTRDGMLDKSISSYKFKVIKADYKWHTFAEQTNFLGLLNKQNLNLMHFTYLSYPFLYKKTFISTIHDLTHLIYKSGKASTKNNLIYKAKYLAYRCVLNAQIKNSREIIVPTNVIKDQIISVFGTKYEAKVHPIYEGVNKNLTSAIINDDLRKKFQGDYLIYIGNFYPHKNIQKLVQAFKLVRGNTKLILIGPRDFFAQKIKDTILDLKLDEKIIMFHDASLSDLRFFYKNAKGLIHPSLSEGFCLPLIEAAYFNLPILASNIPVFKEVLGNNYSTFDPKYTEDITRGIEEFLTHEKKCTYKDFESKYSFDDMARKTVQLYKSYL